MLNLFESGPDPASYSSLRVTYSARLIKRFFRILLLTSSFLCLDAALVALGWSRILGGELGAARDAIFLFLTVEELALFLSVWMIYLIDRLYDTRSNAEIDAVPLRHRFARSHPGILLGCLLSAAVLLLLLTPFFSAETWTIGLVVGSGVVAYFFFFRFRAVPARKRESATGLRIPRKEFAVSLFFVAGVWGASGLSLSGRPATIFAGISLFLLVLANCLLIASAERDYDRNCDPASYASCGSVAPQRLIPGLLLTASTAATAFGALSRNMAITMAFFVAAAGLSTLTGRRIQGSLVAPMADTALMTPWLFLLCKALAAQGG